MKTRSLFLLGTAAFLVTGVLGATEAYAPDQICTFETSASTYAVVTGPPEHLTIQWHTATGRVESFKWLHDGKTTWYAYGDTPAAHGSVTRVYAYYNQLDLKIAAGPDRWAGIRGYIAPDKSLVNPQPSTFAGVYEATGSAWIVAKGTTTCTAP